MLGARQILVGPFFPVKELYTVKFIGNFTQSFPTMYPWVDTQYTKVSVTTTAFKSLGSWKISVRNAVYTDSVLPLTFGV